MFCALLGRNTGTGWLMAVLFFRISAAQFLAKRSISPKVCSRSALPHRHLVAAFAQGALLQVFNDINLHDCDLKQSEAANLCPQPPLA